MTVEEIRLSEIDYCKNNIDYYVETYCHIEDKDADELIQPFNLWEGQRKALLSMIENRLNVVLKARQLGITWLVLAISSWVLICSTGRLVVALSRTEEEAKELVRRLGVILRYMPELIAEYNNVPTGWTGPVFQAYSLTLEIAFPNGPQSVFKAFASAPGASRSFTADLLVLDEWAFQQSAREIWTSGYPTINRPNGGRVIGLSTIDRGTLFEEIFTDDGNDFNKIFLPWDTDPRRDAEWYARTKRNLGDKTMQEYPASIEEALTIPGGAFFPEVAAHLHLQPPAAHLESVRRYVCIDYGLDMFSAHWVYLDNENHARVYREFDAPDFTIYEACREIINRSAGEKIDFYLAPPDLWNREQVEGKSRAVKFYENGILLTKTSNDFAAGCANIKEWLRVPEEPGCLPALTIDRDAAPNLYSCLIKIQKDKKRPDVYAKQPHNLTHDIDSLRCFCVYWTAPLKPKKIQEHDAIRDNFKIKSSSKSALGKGGKYNVI